MIVQDAVAQREDQGILVFPAVIYSQFFNRFPAPSELRVRILNNVSLCVQQYHLSVWKADRYEPSLCTYSSHCHERVPCLLITLLFEIIWSTWEHVGFFGYLYLTISLCGLKHYFTATDIGETKEIELGRYIFGVLHLFINYMFVIY